MLLGGIFVETARVEKGSGNELWRLSQLLRFVIDRLHSAGLDPSSTVHAVDGFTRVLFAEPIRTENSRRLLASAT